MSFWNEFFSKLYIGVLTTLQLLAVAIPSSIILGIFIGVLRVYGGKIEKTLANLYVHIFRGFPLLVTLMIMFFGLADIGIRLTPYWAAALAIIVCSSAYQSEYVRMSILSIDEGQSLAARSLGMKRSVEILYIILPQALRIALPGIGNEIIYMILYSSLAYIVGVNEIFSVAISVNSIWFKPTEVFLTTALIYLAMTTMASYGLKKLERKLWIPGFETDVKR